MTSVEVTIMTQQGNQTGQPGVGRLRESLLIGGAKEVERHGEPAARGASTDTLVLLVELAMLHRLADRIINFVFGQESGITVICNSQTLELTPADDPDAAERRSSEFVAAVSDIERSSEPEPVDDSRDR